MIHRRRIDATVAIVIMSLIAQKNLIMVVGSANQDLTSTTEVVPAMGETVMGKDFSTSCGAKVPTKQLLPPVWVLRQWLWSVEWDRIYSEAICFPTFVSDGQKTFDASVYKPNRS